MHHFVMGFLQIFLGSLDAEHLFTDVMDGRFHISSQFDIDNRKEVKTFMIFCLKFVSCKFSQISINLVLMIGQTKLVCFLWTS